jgi:threonine dehydratase
MIGLAIVRRHVERVVLVSDDAAARARRLLWDRCRIAAEPGAATPLAALLTGVYTPQPDERVALVISGGNGDPADLTSVDVTDPDDAG